MLKQLTLVSFLLLCAHSANAVLILDRKIKGSPYEKDVANYFNTLKTKLPVSNTPAAKNAFPSVGEKPAINEKGLSFLTNDVTSACVVVGHAVDGDMKANWFGKSSTSKIEMWSTTKVVLIPYIIARATSDSKHLNTNTWKVKTSRGTFSFNKILDSITDYSNQIGSSNSLALMLKHFFTTSQINSYVQKLFGDSGLLLSAGYYDQTFDSSPTIIDSADNKVLLSPANYAKTTDNLMSTYAMARFFGMVGWHMNLELKKKIPGVQFSSTEGFIRALGIDTARYIDEAFKDLKLVEKITNPVIISKLGAGASSSRGITEFVYSAFVRFTLNGLTKSASMSLIVACSSESQCDKSMNTAVREVMRRVVDGSLK